MKCNVGGTDRILRVIIGLIIIALGIYFESFLGFIGLIPVLTAVFRICPLYIPLRFSTCDTNTKD